MQNKVDKERTGKLTRFFICHPVKSLTYDTGILLKASEFLIQPLEAFKKSREDETQSVTRYYITFLLVNVVLTGLVSLMGLGILGLIRRTSFLHHPLIIFFLILLGGILGAPLLKCGFICGLYRWWSKGFYTLKP